MAVCAGAGAGRCGAGGSLRAGLLRPLSTAAAGVSRFGPQNLGERIRLDSGPDPFKGLTDALDDALDRLAAGYESQRRFAANASHELRTPLAVQRLLTEVAMEDPAAGEDLRRLGAQLLRTNERNEQLIEGLLALAESDRGIQGKVPVRLDELAGRVLDAHAGWPRRPRSRCAASWRRPGPGDEVLLERLIANLVSNAIKYNQPGGWVELEVAAGRSGDADGAQHRAIRCRAEAVPALFEPFRRLGSDRVQGTRRGRPGPGHRPLDRHRPRGHDPGPSAPRRRPRAGDRPAHQDRAGSSRPGRAAAGRAISSGSSSSRRSAGLVTRAITVIVSPCANVSVR